MTFDEKPADSPSISVDELHGWLNDGVEVALIDVRGQGTFSEKNLFHAASLPLGRLELLLADALPRTSVRIAVISDEGDGLAERGASRLRILGYSDVHVVAGGISAWERRGLPVYSGTHVRSKAFSEVIEEVLHTPWIDVEELAKRKKAGIDLAIFDSRSFPEYQKVTVPGAISLPSAELVRHIRDQVPHEDTLVVVNCGGRTRSIIGAQALISAGLPNPVVSLKDGTMGMRFFDLSMEHGAARRPTKPSRQAEKWGAEAAARVAKRHEIRTIDEATLTEWRVDRERTVYVFDVRMPEEYNAGHLPDSISAQGGQLLQEIDTNAPVWGARIVLVDDKHLIRARMTASWLIQLGCRDVVVMSLGDGPLDVGLRPLRVLGLQGLNGRDVEPITVEALHELIAGNAVTIVDLSLSTQYRAGHIPGAWFVTRERLAECVLKLPRTSHLALTSEDGLIAQFAAAEIGRVTDREIRILTGGNRAWRASGRALSEGAERLGDIVDDAWIPPPFRDGDVKAAIEEYLTWEVGLAHQVNKDPLVQFQIADTETSA